MSKEVKAGLRKDGTIFLPTGEFFGDYFPPTGGFLRTSMVNQGGNCTHTWLKGTDL